MESFSTFDVVSISTLNPRSLKPNQFALGFNYIIDQIPLFSPSVRE